MLSWVDRLYNIACSFPLASLKSVSRSNVAEVVADRESVGQLTAIIGRQICTILISGFIRTPPKQCQ
jgi:hypothetical protein